MIVIKRLYSSLMAQLQNLVHFMDEVAKSHPRWALVNLTREIHRKYYNMQSLT